jgi:hypothetical protein
VLAACAPSEIAQLYAGFLHCVVTGSDLSITYTVSKGDLAPTLFIMSSAKVQVPNTKRSELRFRAVLDGGGREVRFERLRIPTGDAELLGSNGPKCLGRARGVALRTAEKLKMAVCSGCGGKYPHRELIELHEDNHDNLTCFHGEDVCKRCACTNGVSF